MDDNDDGEGLEDDEYADAKSQGPKAKAPSTSKRSRSNDDDSADELEEKDLLLSLKKAKGM